jgi:hypothetical protein
MIRETIIAESDTYTIHFPKSWIGKRVSVMYDEEEESKPSFTENNSVSSKQEFVNFYNKISLDFSSFKFNRDDANER